jgi:hypothetical protein
MKSNKLIIQVKKPIAGVFDFTVNPKNTALWVNSIVCEETNEWPVQQGTIYRNKNRDGKWSEYTMTHFDENKSFTLSLKDANYHVRYTFKELGTSVTEFEYYEWVDTGELEEPFTINILEKLKLILEN